MSLPLQLSLCALHISYPKQLYCSDWWSTADTLQVKLWHKLGRLTITCSTPPDIILSYTDTAQNLEQPSRASQIDSSATSHTSSCTGLVVRITYSQSRAILQLDLSTRSAGGPQCSAETFRSKRVIAVPTVDTRSIYAATVPQYTDQERKATQYDASEKQAATMLGVHTSTWSSAEREALRRLWILRPEWRRFSDNDAAA